MTAYSQPVKLAHALDLDDAGSSALNARAHGVEEVRQVDDLRLAGAVLKDGAALGHAGGHEQVLRAADGGKVEHDARADEPAANALNVAGVEDEPRAHALQRLQVQVHGPRADGAAAGQGHLGLAEQAQKRPKAQHRGAHGLHQVIGGLVLQLAHLGRDHVVLEGRLAAKDVQELEGGVDVAQAGHVGEAHRALGQQAGGEDGQGRVLGAADLNVALELHAAFNNKLVHDPSLVFPGQLLAGRGILLDFVLDRFRAFG